MTNDKKIDVAVITGGKAHDVFGFHKLFADLSGITSYIQHIIVFFVCSQVTIARLGKTEFSERYSSAGYSGVVGNAKEKMIHEVHQ